MPATPLPNSYPPLPNMTAAQAGIYGPDNLQYMAKPDEEITPKKIPYSVAANLLRLERRWTHRRSDRLVHRQLELLWENRRWGDSTLKGSGETVERSRDIKPHFMPNLLRQIINPLTYLYDAPPVRKPQNPGDEVWMREGFWDFGEVGRLDWLMGEGDRLARLHGTVWTQLVYRPSPDMARDFRHMVERADGADYKRAGFDLMFFPPHRFEVAPSCLDPTVAEAVVVFTGDDEYEGDFLVGMNVLDIPSEGYYWDGEFFGILRGFQLVPLNDEGHLVMRHDIGEIPGLPIRNEVTTDRFWVWGVGGADAHQDILDIAKLWREYPFTAMSARGAFFMRGKFKGANMAFGPDTVFESEEGDSDVKGIKSEADLAGIRTALNTMVEAFARGCNVPAALVRLDEKQTPQSGRAMILQSAEIEDDRPTRIRLFSQIERGLHRRANAIRLAVARGVVQLPSQVPGLEQITYANYQPQLTRAEVSFDVKFKLEQKLISRMQAMRELHPGVEDDVLKERLAEAQAEAMSDQPSPPALSATEQGQPNDRQANKPPSRNVHPDPAARADNTDPTAHPPA